MSFDIREHLKSLTPVERKKNRYYCPICEGNNLTIKPESGTYQCWNGCECEDIRNAIAPLTPLDVIPKPQRQKSDRTWSYTDSNGKEIIKTRRVDDGQGKRKIWQEYLIDDREAAKKAVMPYNYAAVQAAIASGEPVFWVEGEPCVDAMTAIGLTATTSIGGSAGYGKYGNYSQALKGAKLIICPDRDLPGLKYAGEVAKDYPDAQWLYALPDSPLWNRLSKDGGLDIADWIEDLRKEQLSNEKIRDRILGAIEPQRVKGETNEKPVGKPRVDLRAGKILEAASAVLAHFGSTPDSRDRIYAQGNSQGYTLVRVLKTVKGIENRYLHIGKDNDVLEPLALDSLQLEINRAFEIYRWGEKQGKLVKTRTDCPANLARSILAMGRWPQLPILRGLSYTPLLTKTGEVITQPGYHEGTGYLLQFDPVDFNIKSNPTKEDAIASLDVLKDLLSEFCFKSDIDRSVALSMLLTSVSRKLYPFAPLHAVTAHQPGTGKGTLIDLACILSTGNKEAGKTGFTDNEEEMRKKILSILLSGVPIVNIDNIDKGKRLGGGTLEIVLTAPVYRERILGVSKDAFCSTQVLWVACGNNLAFTTDMARRTLLCELDAAVELPHERVFSRDIESYALESRGKLVSAALTILQAYIKTSDKVSHSNPPLLGSFGEWDAVVRRSLLWLGEPDPVQSQSTIREGDDSRVTLAIFLETWHSRLGSTSYQAREIVDEARIAGEKSDFQNAIFDVCRDRQGTPSIKFLSYYLRTHNGVVVNGYRLVKGQRLNSGFPWRVEKVEKVSKSQWGDLSTPSTPKLAQTLTGKDIDLGVDKDRIYTSPTSPQIPPHPIGVDAKSSTPHLHPLETLTQQAFLASENKNSVDSVDNYPQPELSEEEEGYDPVWDD